jgi:hypothetical protein
MARFEDRTGSHTWNKVNSNGERQTVIDPIPALFVCVLPDGPLEFGTGSWLTSRKSTRSFFLDGLLLTGADLR